VGQSLSVPEANNASKSSIEVVAAIASRIRTDFALTAALTTDLNPWCEFSTDLFGTRVNNFQ
jgi:hypothetical protein